VDIIQRIVDQVRCFFSEGRSGNTGLTYLAVQKALSPISLMCHVQCHLYVWIYTHVKTSYATESFNQAIEAWKHP